MNPNLTGSRHAGNFASRGSSAASYGPRQHPRKKTEHTLVTTALLTILLTTSCAVERRPVAESREFRDLWRRYGELPDARAMAVAGRLESNRWVAGVVGGMPTSESAEQRALIECRKKRRRARMASLCRLYAIGAQRVRDLERAPRTAPARDTGPKRSADETRPGDYSPAGTSIW